MAVAIVAAGVAVAAWNATRLDQRGSTFAATARDLGLGTAAGRSVQMPEGVSGMGARTCTSAESWSGPRGELHLFAGGRNQNQHDGGLLILTGVRPGITLRAQTFMDRIVDSAAYQSVVGDEGFDRAVLVRGGSVVLAALFDAETRGLLRAALSKGVVVAEGRVWVPFPGPLELGLELVTRLSRPPVEWPDRLARIAVEDPAPGVRIRAFHALFTLDEGRGREIARTLLSDADPDVRLAACPIVGADALPTLMELFVSHPDAALTEMEQIDPVRTLAFAREQLAQGNGVVIPVLSRLGDRTDIEPLHQWAEEHPEGADAAKSAIAAIQARDPDLGRGGRLAIAEGEGALSLAGGGGDVAVAEISGAVSSPDKT